MAPCIYLDCSVTWKETNNGIEVYQNTKAARQFNLTAHIRERLQSALSGEWKDSLGIIFKRT